VSSIGTGLLSGSTKSHLVQFNSLSAKLLAHLKIHLHPSGGMMSTINA
jgi:hypothetical protein